MYVYSLPEKKGSEVIEHFSVTLLTDCVEVDIVTVISLVVIRGVAGCCWVVKDDAATPDAN